MRITKKKRSKSLFPFCTCFRNKFLLVFQLKVLFLEIKSNGFGKHKNKIGKFCATEKTPAVINGFVKIGKKKIIILNSIQNLCDH